MKAPENRHDNIEIGEPIAHRIAKGVAERLAWYILGPAAVAVFLALVFWGISHLPAPDAGTGVGEKILQDLQASHKPLETAFPDRLGGMKRESVTNYEKKEKGLGIGIKYNGPSQIWADIFVYNLGLTRIPNNLHSEEVKAHFAQVKKDIFTMEQSGHYQAVQEISLGMEPLGRAVSAPQALTAHYSYKHTLDRLAVFSHIYLGVYNNHFIKIRFSYPKESEAEGQNILSRFLDEFGELLANPAAL